LRKGKKDEIDRLFDDDDGDLEGKALKKKKFAMKYQNKKKFSINKFMESLQTPPTQKTKIVKKN
jgi:hypothetical protein